MRHRPLPGRRRPRPIVVCHCGQCRRIHGGPAPYTAVPARQLRIGDGTGLVWYESSPGIRRGFCRLPNARDGHPYRAESRSLRPAFSNRRPAASGRRSHRQDGHRHPERLAVVLHERARTVADRDLPRSGRDRGVVHAQGPADRDHEEGHPVTGAPARLRLPTALTIA
ncbi:MAG: hypothetical protein HC859_05325, partial [Bacteroidia bacterium]|nr:hypothetical protein [Bacteroidia bacterium]